MMKSKNTILYVLMAFVLVLTSCSLQEDVVDLQNQPDLQEHRRRAQRVVVCNRGSQDISIINARNNNLINTIAMPDNGEPMYAVHVPQVHRVFVGDRANNRVVAFNERNYNVVGFAPCGNGVFHMWASPDGCQLWVNNDIDNTTTVINPHDLSVIATVATPADLVADGGKPHDVIISPNNNAAYVTVLGLAGADDFVVKYNTNTFNEVARAPVGKDPHVSVTSHNNRLYVLSQGNGQIHVLRRGNLSTVAVVPFSGAHGVGMSRSGDYMYVTDLPGSRLGVLETATNNIFSGTITTPSAVPHNIAVNRRGSKAFVTHSGGMADQLSIYTTNPQATLQTSITVGTNPFGLVYYSFRRN